MWVTLAGRRGEPRRLARRIGLARRSGRLRAPGARSRRRDGRRPVGGPDSAVDAMVTRVPGIGLAVLVADCAPVLLADPRPVSSESPMRGVGAWAGVVPASSRRCATSVRPEITARIGPSVCGRCYEVPAELRDEVADGPGVMGHEPHGHAGSRRGSRRRGPARARRAPTCGRSTGARSRTRRCSPTAATARRGASPAWPGCRCRDPHRDPPRRDRRRPCGRHGTGRARLSRGRA